MSWDNPYDPHDLHQDRRDDMPRWYDHSRDETMAHEYFMERNRDREREHDYERSYDEFLKHQLQIYYGVSSLIGARKQMDKITSGLSWYFD